MTKYNLDAFALDALVFKARNSIAFLYISRLLVVLKKQNGISSE